MGRSELGSGLYEEVGGVHRQDRGGCYLVTRQASQLADEEGAQVLVLDPASDS